MLKAVGAVLFHSEHPQRLVRFYRDVLGLQASFGGEDGAEFRLGDVRIGLWQHSEIRGPAREPNRVILNFVVDDIVAEYQLLKGRGVEFIKAPSSEDWGGKTVTLATFRDPDGNLLQLLKFED